MAKAKAEKSKIQELENQLKRAIADYSNLQNRIEQEKQHSEQRSKAQVLNEFVNILDYLELAEKSEAKKDLESIRRGIELAVKEFKNTLNTLGVEEMNAKGKFNPEIHEAVEVVEGQRDGEIVQVLAKGYKIGDRILRPAKVKVSKKGLN